MLALATLMFASDDAEVGFRPVERVISTCASVNVDSSRSPSHQSTSPPERMRLPLQLPESAIISARPRDNMAIDKHRARDLSWRLC